MNTTRSYTMTTRARSAEQTRLRILDAVLELQAGRLVPEIALGDVAATAGVSVQTILRRFGSRAGLLSAAIEHMQGRVVEERRAPVGDVPAAVGVIVDHYEQRGDGVILLLAQEHADALVQRITDDGRTMHRAWVQEVFAPHLPDTTGHRDELIDLLVVATDVYTWKLLRRDRGLSRDETENRMHHLVSALLAVSD